MWERTLPRGQGQYLLQHLAKEPFKDKAIALFSAHKPQYAAPPTCHVVVCWLFVASTVTAARGRRQVLTPPPPGGCCCALPAGGLHNSAWRCLGLCHTGAERCLCDSLCHRGPLQLGTCTHRCSTTVSCRHVRDVSSACCKNSEPRSARPIASPAQQHVLEGAGLLQPSAVGVGPRGCSAPCINATHRYQSSPRVCANACMCSPAQRLEQVLVHQPTDSMLPAAGCCADSHRQK